MKKRFMALLLSVCMIMSVCSLTVFADDTDISVPAAPTDLDVCILSSGNFCYVWKSPVSDGGSAITGYVIYMHEAGSSAFTTAPVNSVRQYPV